MEWISVKDRLPDKRDIYLIYAGDGIGLADFEIDAQIWNIQPYCNVWYRSKSCVTHWMPLPEPPERDTIRINVNVQGDAAELTLAEFEDRVCRIVKRAMWGVKRGWGPHDD